VVRRLQQELGIVADSLVLALPEFSYRASFLGVEEHELCPVFLARADAEPAPDPAEVAATGWWHWPDFVAEALAADSRISPWAQEQVRQLDSGGHVERFLAADQPACNR
jgi:isopentenyl-diphosphate delta-isomerase